MFSLRSTGSFNKTLEALDRMRRGDVYKSLDRYGQMGVNALASVTPTDSGKTANSWRYEIENRSGRTTIHWVNDNVNQGANIALLIQHGHGTGTGGYVAGYDYINPTMRPIFDTIADMVFQEFSQ